MVKMKKLQFSSRFNFRLLSVAVTFALVFASLFSLNLTRVFSATVNINDNEMGWYGLDVYKFGNNGQDIMDIVRPAGGGEKRSSDVDTYPIDSTNSYAITWMQCINWTVGESGGRTATDMQIYKDLPQPVTGGEFSFYYWLGNPAAKGSFGLEAIAYEADGTAHSLGKMYDDVGVGFGGDVGWVNYKKAFPADVVVAKMGIRTYLIENPTGQQSIPNSVSTAENYSRIDEIEFLDTTLVGTKIMVPNTPAWVGTNLKDFDQNNQDFWHTIDDQSLAFRPITSKDPNTTNKASLEKEVDVVKDGSFSYKVCSIANVAGGDPMRYYVKTYVYGTNGTEYDLGRYPSTEGEYLKFSMNTGNQTFNGWNNIVAPLPAGVSINKVKIEIIDAANYARDDLIMWMDDFKFLGSESGAAAAAPVATDSNFQVNKDTPHTGTVSATDVNGDPLTFSVVAQPAHGSVTMQGTGNYTYTPTTGYVGTDSFTFKANDGALDSNTATVSITVVDPGTYQGSTNYTEKVYTGAKDINDNELGWYSPVVIKRPEGTADSVRIMRYDANATAEDKIFQNFYVRRETDSDETAILFMNYLNTTGFTPKLYESSIVKELSEPVKGGSFSFYYWYRNGLPENWDICAIEAIAYDAAGTAYPLGSYPDEELLKWSGDHTYEEGAKPNQFGWYHYQKPLPPDVVVEKMEIKLFKFDENSPGGLPNGAEDHSMIDEIMFFNTTTPYTTTFDNEKNWDGDNIAMGSLTDLNNPWMILQGPTALDFDADFNINDNDTGKVTLHKDLDQYMKGGRFSFKIFNTSDVNVEGQPKFSVKAYALTTDGERIDLGRYPKETTEYMRYGGSAESFQIYGGYNYYIADLPAGKEIKGIDIEITNDNTKGATVNFYIDEIKFVDSEITKSLEPDDSEPDSSNSGGNNNSTSDGANGNNGNGNGDGDGDEHIQAGLRSVSFVILLVISGLAGAALIVSKKKRKSC